MPSSRTIALRATADAFVRELLHDNTLDLIEGLPAVPLPPCKLLLCRRPGLLALPGSMKLVLVS